MNKKTVKDFEESSRLADELNKNRSIFNRLLKFKTRKTLRKQKPVEIYLSGKNLAEARKYSKDLCEWGLIENKNMILGMKIIFKLNVGMGLVPVKWMTRKELEKIYPPRENE